MTESTITKTVFFAASRETVWSFLTDKDKLAQWWHGAEANLAEGEEYGLLHNDDDGEPFKLIWGRVLEMQPPSLLVYTFIVKPLQGAETIVTWRLEEARGGTRLTLIHSGLEAMEDEPALRMLMSLDAGWDEHFRKLRAVIADH